MFRQLIDTSLKERNKTLRQLHEVTYINWVVFAMCSSYNRYSISISKTFLGITITSLDETKVFMTMFLCVESCSRSLKFKLLSNGH